MRLVRLVLAFVVLLVFTSGVASAASYTYVGNAYNKIVDGGTAGTFTESMSVSGTMTLTAPMAPNLDEFDVSGSLVSFSFFNGRTNYTHLDLLGGWRDFVFSTDAAGEITGWRVQLSDALNAAMILTMDLGVPTNVEDLGVINGGAGLNDEGKILNSPGVWTAVPEPSTALLLGLGLVGMAARRKNR